MCYHKRLLYTCKHFTFTMLVRPCSIQKDYDQGLSKMPCEWMHAHPLHSLVIQRRCPGCEAKQTAVDQKMSEVRRAIRGLRESVERIRGESLERENEEKKKGESGMKEEEKEVEERGRSRVRKSEVVEFEEKR